MLQDNKRQDLRPLSKEQIAIEKQPKMSSHVARENAVFICPNVSFTSRAGEQKSLAKVTKVQASTGFPKNAKARPVCVKAFVSKFASAFLVHLLTAL